MYCTAFVCSLTQCKSLFSVCYLHVLVHRPPSVILGDWLSCKEKTWGCLHKQVFTLCGNMRYLTVLFPKACTLWENETLFGRHKRMYVQLLANLNCANCCVHFFLLSVCLAFFVLRTVPPFSCVLCRWYVGWEKCENRTVNFLFASASGGWGAVDLLHNEEQCDNATSVFALKEMSLTCFVLPSGVGVSGCRDVLC